MSDIKFGVTYAERADFTDLPAYAQKVEALGLDSIWVTENIGSGAPALECFTALSFMAAHTSKLMVGTSVMLLPLRNPVMVAQTVASLDILSGGRAVLGVGVGNESPDFAAYGGNVRERASRSDEALEIIKRLWTEDSVTFHGKHFNLDDYQLLPKPVQKPHPPIHVGGGAASVVRRAGRFANSLIPVSKTPEEAKAMFERAEEHARESGRDDSAMTRVMHLFLCFSGSAEESAEIASGVFTRRYGSSTTVPADAPHLLGTPDQMRKMVQAFVDVGVAEFVLNVVCRPEEGISQVERFAKEVVAGFR